MGISGSSAAAQMWWLRGSERSWSGTYQNGHQKRIVVLASTSPKRLKLSPWPQIVILASNCVPFFFLECGVSLFMLKNEKSPERSPLQKMLFSGDFLNVIFCFVVGGNVGGEIKSIGPAPRWDLRRYCSWAITVQCARFPLLSLFPRFSFSLLSLSLLSLSRLSFCPLSFSPLSPLLRYRWYLSVLCAIIVCFR